ncbi:MAG: hypothetical protein PVG70_10200 [Desulfobacterales bacterium]|jgi:tetratricopeptide (TPR) repeat protein
MGTKRTWKRQHFFIYFACLLIIPLAVGGCLHWPRKSQGEQDLVKARYLMTDGNYHAALVTSQKVFDQYPQSLADQALFMMGWIYAHPESPDHNYQKALNHFQRITEFYPESELKADARLWSLVILEIVEKEKEIRQLKLKFDSLQQEADRQKKKIDRLQDQLEKLKHIDLKIEEEKRKVIPQPEDLKEHDNGKDSGS